MGEIIRSKERMKRFYFEITFIPNWGGKREPNIDLANFERSLSSLSQILNKYLRLRENYDYISWHLIINETFAFLISLASKIIWIVDKTLSMRIFERTYICPSFILLRSCISYIANTSRLTWLQFIDSVSTCYIKIKFVWFGDSY